MRVILIVLDSVGIGELPDANLYNDNGSNTLENIAKKIKGFSLPNLESFGLGMIDGVKKFKKNNNVIANYGKMAERSKGKDTTTGHWELSGIVLEKPFPVYDKFPDEIIKNFEKKIGRSILGNYPSSGTEIIKLLGDEHVRTGCPIVYTSADSVFQIASHEDVVSIEELYKYCEIAREILVGEHSVARVIARPFSGDKGNYYRTKNRKDFSLIPPKDTMLDFLVKNKKEVVAIGKIEDIFCNKGITRSIHSKTNSEGIQETIKVVCEDFEGLIFTNLVDFDMLYGHRNNIEGYANALIEFDNCIPLILEKMKNNDILIITADHGCDPTTISTDHSREYVPLFVYSKNIENGINLGIRNSFTDVACSVLEYFNIANNFEGESFLHLK